MIYEPLEDSYLLKEQVIKFARDKSVLDLGSGSGILAIAAEKAGAKSVLASDINEESIKHIKNLNIKAIKSNLFASIKGKFDLIIFNPPYLPLDKREPFDSQLATTGGKKGDEIILLLLKQSKYHLNKDGIILLLLSSLTPRKRIISLLKSLSLKYKIISSKNLFMETLEVWEISKKIKTRFKTSIKQ